MKFYYWTRSESESLGIGENGPYRLLHRERYYRKLERFKNKNRRVQEMEKQVIENVLIYLNGEPKRVDITIYPRVEGNNRKEVN